MSEAAVFGDYDQQGLDAQYNNRGLVPGFQDYVDRYVEGSAAARRDLECTLSQVYGDGEAESVDVFHASGDGPAPIHVFFHGGYWMAFDKKDFSFVAGTLVAAGACVVVVNYPLVPAVDLDTQVQCCRDALAWVYANAAAIGGDASRIHISGHSAGGHLVAMMMATDWPAQGGLPADLIKSGLAISGLFDLEAIRLSYLNETLGLDAEAARRNSPVSLRPATGAPLVAAVGDEESDEFKRQSDDLAARWHGADGSCTAWRCAGLNHFSMIAELFDADSPMTKTALGQMGLD